MPALVEKFKSLLFCFCFLKGKAAQAVQSFLTKPNFGWKCLHPPAIKHNKLPFAEHKYDSPAHVSSPWFPFNIQIPYDTNGGKGHHPSCAMPPSPFLRVSVRTKARVPFVTHGIPVQFSQRRQPNKTPLWFTMEGPTSLLTGYAHSLGARPLPPHGGRCHRQQLVSLCSKTTRCKNDR